MGGPIAPSPLVTPQYWAGEAGSIAAMLLAGRTTGRVTSRESSRRTTGRAWMTASTTKGTGWLGVAYHYNK